MSTVEITNHSDKIHVVTPYNSEFVAFARRCRAKWNKPAWVFDARDTEAVRTECLRVFGCDGTVSAQMVSVKITWVSEETNRHGPISVMGRTIARAFGRDSGARMGDGFVILSGGFWSGGSVKNWRTGASEGTAILLRDVPERTAQEFISNPPPHLSAEIVFEGGPNEGALREERERLIARIAEIDAILQQEDVR
jgi:hypothetical protein